ncbi:hypothetical protein C8J56DRAFT_520309 [Mycena floridula]|nr:hypothetical protein C8J56DRAFT_520309 [Mycena floridula]
MATYNTLILRAKAGSVPAIKTLSQRCPKDRVLFQRMIPVLFTHLQKIPPSLGDKAVVDGFAPSLASVELAILCMETLNRGFGPLGREVTPPDSTDLNPAMESHRILITEWSAINRWVTFFIGCLDFHRRTTVVLEYHDLYQKMLYTSGRILKTIGIVFGFSLDKQAKVRFFTSQVSGYLGLLVEFTILPSKYLMETLSLDDITATYTTFVGIADHPQIGDEIAGAVLKCIASPGAIEMFQDRMLQIKTGIISRARQSPNTLLGYVTIPLFLVLCKTEKFQIKPIQQAVLWEDMLPSIVRVMALAQDTTLDDNVALTQVIRTCGTCLLTIIRESGHGAALEALKGSSGILFSISQAGKVLESFDTQIAAIYADLLNEITINLIHPPVLRRCSRRLAKHAMLLKTEEPFLRPVVEAGKALLTAVSHWKSRRTDYKTRVDHKLCANSQCRQVGVTSTSVKLCVGCLNRAYCSTACQKTAWRLHEAECNSLAVGRRWIRDQGSGIISHLNIDYFQWNMKNDALSLALKDPNLSSDHIVEVDYRRFPVKPSMVRFADFLQRPVRFPEYDAALRASIVNGDEKTPGIFIYAVVPNGVSHTFPLLVKCEYIMKQGAE